VVAQAQVAAEEEQEHGLGPVDGAAHDVGTDEPHRYGLVEQGARDGAQLAQDVRRLPGLAARGEDRASGDRGDGEP